MNVERFYFCNETRAHGSVIPVQADLSLSGPKSGGHRIQINLYMQVGRFKMNEWIILLVVIGVWILLQAVILPRMGVST
jgi:hypothetical protein